MHICLYSFLFFLPLTLCYPRRHSENDQGFLSAAYFRHQPIHSEIRSSKFGSPRDYIFRALPMYYQPSIPQNPSCRPHVWTCGPDLPPCCPGLMCYDGNAKRGRHCVARG